MVLVMKIIVIGGGIIGMSAASELSRSGHEVTLIDRGHIGQGCSYGNAGWLTPCFALPLPMPGMLLKSIRWMLDPEGPLYIHPKPSLLLAGWLTRFLLSMTEDKSNRSARALVELSRISLEAYARLGQAEPIGFAQKGLLMVAQSETGFHGAQADLQLMKTLNIRGQVLSADEVRKLEPAITGPIAGAVYYPDEAHAEPLEVVKALQRVGERYGLRVIENCELLETHFSGQRMNSVTTTQGEMKADAFVLATGSWSTELGKKFDLSIPLLGGKGYALIVPPLQKQPEIPLMLLEKKIAVTPRVGSLRIAGTLELVNQDFSINQRRVRAIEKGAREFLSLPEKLEPTEVWAGLRPCSPDGVPLIGYHPRKKNVLLACGHQMLGLQSGLGTGIVIRDLVDKRETRGLDLAVFAPGRF